MRRTHSDRNRRLPNGHGPQPMGDTHADQSMLPVRVARDVRHRAQRQWRVRRVAELRHGAGLERVPRGAQEQHVGPRAGRLDSPHQLVRVQFIVGQLDGDVCVWKGHRSGKGGGV